MTARIAREFSLQQKQVEAVFRLLDEGATVPFIARYRKEATGSLDEVVVAALRDRRNALAELEKRREAILASLRERDLLTPALAQAVAQAASLTVLEDVYLPYRPKRRTRAVMAKERGLEPLARWLLAQVKAKAGGTVEAEAARYVVAQQVPDVAAALAGARDIIAEEVSENRSMRQSMRVAFAREGVLRCSPVAGKEAEAAKYQDYFSFEEKVASLPSHRVLAALRAEEEGLLRVQVRPKDEARAVAYLENCVAQGGSPAAAQVRMAARDSYTRLLAPALETELRSFLKKRADAAAIKVFAENVQELLLAPPLGSKAIMGIDPGFRTGCKVVCCTAEGKLAACCTINPHAGSEATRQEAGKTVLAMLAQHSIEAVAVGNGTAGRETEAFLRGLAGWPQAVPLILVNESGASVYSASEVAREEFPDLDLTYRGAVSIARRLADPLAELVKIDPKSIGVGQYQHDVHQGELKKALDDVVSHCVNAVGVDVNTASQQLLTYVSGVGAVLAKNIVAYRHEQGAFVNRRQLLRVPRLGAKAFEQCSGFLRVRGGDTPLDASAVHPEAYAIVERMAADLGVSVRDLMHNAALRARVVLERYVSASVGMPSLTDIMQELEKPGRDPRAPFALFSYTEGVSTLEDVHSGMVLRGVVTNVTAFGAFVDIGVHQDGLVHISQLAEHFVKDPASVVRAGQVVQVRVLEVDKPRRRIALSMKSEAAAP
ncbi:MAG: Tex family protein [Desulfovibrionaceae bacterium]|nr:Tex family protein [Desulfovibrionaceae bacterium]